METVIKILNVARDILTGQDLPSFVSGIKTLFIIVGVIFFFLTVYFYSKAGYYRDKAMAWKWKTKDAEKGKD